MGPLTAEQITEQLLGVLREAFEGAAQFSYFTDSGPEAGLSGALAALQADEASRPVAGSSIAAHVHHVTFGLDVAAAWINGDRQPRDWNQSWSITTVTDSEWSRLQQKMQANLEVLRMAIAAHSMSSIESFGGALGAIAHVAYHLGAIKQKIALLRGK